LLLLPLLTSRFLHLWALARRGAGSRPQQNGHRVMRPARIQKPTLLRLESRFIWKPRQGVPCCGRQIAPASSDWLHAGLQTSDAGMRIVAREYRVEQNVDKRAQTRPAHLAGS